MKDKEQDIEVDADEVSTEGTHQQEAIVEKELKAAIAKVKKAAKKSEKTIEITKPLSGTFLLSDTVGEIVNKDAKLADAIIESGRAKQV